MYVRPSVRPSRPCRRCKSSTNGPINSKSSLSDPSGSLVVQRHIDLAICPNLRCPWAKIWVKMSIFWDITYLADAVTAQPTDQLQIKFIGSFLTSHFNIRLHSLLGFSSVGHRRELVHHWCLVADKCMMKTRNINGGLASFPNSKIFRSISDLYRDDAFRIGSISLRHRPACFRIKELSW